MRIICVLICILLISLYGCRVSEDMFKTKKNQNPEIEHQDHDHDQKHDHDHDHEHDHNHNHDHDHEGKHDHHNHDNHDHEHSAEHSEEEGELTVSPQFIKMAGITVAKVSRGKISKDIEFWGEIGFDEDRVVHISPRFSGIVKEVNYRVGEYVNAGSVVATIESNQSMTQYSLKAPISGRIIKKHAVPGEHVSESESIYMIADLSVVWANLTVYPKDVSKVRIGQKVTVKAMDTGDSVQGIIQYISPVMDSQTRSITARVVLSNNNNLWRPGTFIKAQISAEGEKEGLVVDKNAVQLLDGRDVVFISHEPGVFKPVDIIVGESDSRKTLILDGLHEGDNYVANGAFELKAKIVTSSFDAHAGHGH
jgi:cobalt-zinc-cadmium efflux system membrane fusion protein